MDPRPRGPARALSEVLVPLRRSWSRDRRARAALALPDTLAACLGPRRAAAVGFGGIRGGTLTLTVDSAPLLGELDAFHRRPLLEAIQASPEGARIRSLRFVPSGDVDAR